MNKHLAVALLIMIAAGGVSCAARRPQSQVSIGVWAAEHDLWEEAVFRWKLALESHPNSAAAHNNLAVAYEKKGLFDDARREYETALKLAPSQPQIKSNYQKFKLAVERKEEQPKKKTEGSEEQGRVAR